MEVCGTVNGNAKKSRLERIHTTEMVATNGSDTSDIFQCERCALRCDTERAFRAHMFKHRDLKPYPCLKCQDSFNTGAALRKHLAEDHHGEVEESAEECERDDATLAAMEVDENGSELSDMVKPTSKKLSSRRVADRNIQCSLCPRLCLTKKSFQAHMNTHRGLRAFPCTQCERSFNRESLLRKHIMDAHVQEEKKQKDCEADVRTKHRRAADGFVCEECGHKCSSLLGLKYHRYRHLSKEQYPHHCEPCGKHFVLRKSYDIHLLSHTGIKNFDCPYCDMKKATNAELKKHINLHTKEREWHCSLCPEKVFYAAENLYRHQITHRSNKPFQCPECMRSFCRSGSLKTHIRRHNKEKPYTCVFCDKSYVTVTELKKHMTQHR